MKFLLYEIITRAGFNLATGRFWPTGRMFDTPDIVDKGEIPRMMQYCIASYSEEALIEN